MLTNLLALIGIQFLAVMSPGPDFLLVVKNSLLYSRKSSFMTALGIAAGCVFISFIIIITLLIAGTQFAQVFKIFYLLGALYLIYLGILSAIECIDTYRVNKSNSANNNHKTSTANSTFEEATSNTIQGELNFETKTNAFFFRSGLFCNFLNPKAWVYFFSVFLATQNYHATQILQIGISIGLIFAITLAWFSILGYALSSGFIKNRLESYKLWITAVSAIGFFGFGLFLGIDGIKAIS